MDFLGVETAGTMSPGHITRRANGTVAVDLYRLQNVAHVLKSSLRCQIALVVAG